MIDISKKIVCPVSDRAIKKVVARFLETYDRVGSEVSIVIIADDEMAELNQRYRQKIGPTDVLSFVGADFPRGDKNFLGEIILDWPQIERQAQEQAKSSEEEFIFILVHGLLHLVGYSDETEERRRGMIDLGNKFIASLE